MGKILSISEVQHITVNLQKFLQWYRAVSTPMKQQNVVVHRVRVEHRFFVLVESASFRKLDPTQ